MFRKLTATSILMVLSIAAVSVSVAKADPMTRDQMMMKRQHMMMVQKHHMMMVQKHRMMMHRSM